MKKVIIIHGWGGHPEEGWFPWLKKELEAKGHKVEVPSMPNSENPIIEDWVAHLAKTVGKPDKDTYFVGHSIGCQTILRYLETLDGDTLGGAVFVAGWFNLLNMEDEEGPIAKPWLETPIDLMKVKVVLPKSVLIISDNDPHGFFEENKKEFEKLGSKIMVLHDAGHINEEAGYTELPEALTAFESF